MKTLLAAFLPPVCCGRAARATTIMVVPVFEPLSLHGTDGDEAISDTGEALQACVMSRPMALTGAFPEVLVDAIRSPHLIPTNNPNYKVQETNLLVLCNIGISGGNDRRRPHRAAGRRPARHPAGRRSHRPPDPQARHRGLRKTLEEYQRPQTQPLAVTIVIEGADEAKAGLRDLGDAIRRSAKPPAEN